MPFDSQLVKEKLHLARSGSEEAVWILLAECRGYLISIARLHFDETLQAKVNPSDLVEDTLIDAQNSFPLFRGESPQEWLGWIRQILLCNLANSKRKYHQQKRNILREIPINTGSNEHRSLGSPANKEPTPSKLAIRLEQEEQLEHALQQLSEEYREVIRLRHEAGLTFEAIGLSMNRSEDSVRRLWAKAIELLVAKTKEVST